MTLIKTPFKKKRSTIAVDGGRSPSTTPQSARGSTARSNSVGSSVNSYEESELVVECNINASTKNIYADIDDDLCNVATNQTAKCDQTPPDLPAANASPKNRFKVIQVSMINECEQFEECVEVTEDDLLKIPGIEHKLNCSKNNLLLIDDHLMSTSSIDNHLNNIELINKNLDKLMETHQMIESDDQDDKISPELKAEKKMMKEKIAEKIKILKEARSMTPSSSDTPSKESFKSRVKNMFPKFEKQASLEDHSGDEKPKEKSKHGKGFLSSFKKKSIPDETDEDFEEIKKVPSDIQIQVGDSDEPSKLDEAKGENFSSKFKHKLKLNIQSTKHLLSSMGKKTPPAGVQICRRCSKRYSISVTGTRIHPSKAVWDFNKEFHTDSLFDTDFCVCEVVDEFEDDGICIKNFEYKDVSVSIGFYLE